MRGDSPGQAPHDEHRPRTRSASDWQEFRAARDAYFHRVGAAGEVARLERAWALPAAPEPPDSRAS